MRRLEKCVALLEHLNSDLSHLDAVLDDVESKLSALVQSENVEVTEGDRSTLETLQNELIRYRGAVSAVNNFKWSFFNFAYNSI